MRTAGLSALLTTVLAIPLTARADDRDTSADLAHGNVKESTGVMLKVPINARGDEDTNAAELRVYKQQTGNRVDSSQLPQMWNAGAAVDSVTAAPADSSTRDSSTWWGWRNWYGWGWRNPYYYYYNYTPYFNYYGNYYNYYGSYYNYYPYSYTYYSPYLDYYGYRYYYYPRYW